VAALTASVAIAAIVAAPACASGVNSAQLRALAGRAETGDQAAVAELRAVDRVDGQPAQLAQALDTSDPRALRDRLGALAAEAVPSAPVASSASARRAAASILSGRRYRASLVPDPVMPVLRQIGRWLRWLGDRAAEVPGGPVVFWGVIGALVLALAAVMTRRSLRRLGGGAGEHARGTASTEGAADEPGALERAAAAAESNGAFADAVRLRFRAGLLGLGARAVIEYSPSVRTAQVARRLRSREFDTLAATFDRVTYGGATAQASDAEAACEGWKRVLAAASG
jgi:hypothetical protein